MCILCVGQTMCIFAERRQHRKIRERGLRPPRGLRAWAWSVPFLRFGQTRSIERLDSERSGQSAKEGGSSKSTCWRSVPAGWPRGGGRNDKPRCLRICLATRASSMTAIMRIAPSQREQAKASMPHARRKSVAHASRRERATSSGPDRSTRGGGVGTGRTRR
jgi:hypothetical protein